MRESLRNLARALLHPDCPGSRLPVALTFLAISSLIVVACWVLGPYPITIYVKDTIYFLSWAHLIADGMHPYADFYAFHGPFPFLFFAAAMHFQGVSLETVVLAQILGALLFGSLMFRIASSRLHPIWAIVFSISVELILVDCTPLGLKVWREFSVAMWYNAMSFCLLAIVFLYLLVPSRSQHWASRGTDVSVIAFCLMASFLTKLTFFLPMAVVFVVGGVLLSRDRSMRIDAIFALTLAAVLSLALMSALGGKVTSYLDFIGSMQLSVNPLLLVLRSVQFSRTIGVFMLGLSLIAWYAYEAGLMRQAWREGVLAVLMLGSFIVAANTSAQSAEIMPLLGVILVGMTAFLVSVARRLDRPVNEYLVVPTLCIGLLLVVQVPKDSILSWGFSHASLPTFSDSSWWRSTPPELRGDLGLSERVDESFLYAMPTGWKLRQLKGLALLREAQVPKTDVLFVAGIQGSINMLTDAPYPKGVVLFWPVGWLANPASLPLPQEVFLADADWILRDLLDPDHFWEYLLYYRGDFIDEHFEEVEANDYWILYRRLHRKGD